MNAFRFPAKVLYNDCTQLFSTLQREGSVDIANFLDEVRVMVGEGAHWDEGLVAKVKELYFSLRERNSVGHLVACVLRYSGMCARARADFHLLERFFC